MWKPISCRLRPRASCAFAVLVALLAAGAFARADTAEQQPFTGVRHIAHQQAEPYPLAWHLLLIEPDAPGIRFTSTAPCGGAPGVTEAETTRAFARRTGVQIAVNANFFAEDKGGCKQVLSLAAADGAPYAPWSESLPHGVNIGRDNRLTFIAPAELNPTGFDCAPRIELFNAVAGNARLVRDGRCVAPDAGARHPRTAIGVRVSGEIMLLVVDGRHPGHSRGVTYRELAEILIAQGARDAVNLDGGGSSTLVIADPEPRVVNVPMPFDAPEGAPVPAWPIERAVGNNLGVFALPR
jgi:hypothetical protein